MVSILATLDGDIHAQIEAMMDSAVSVSYAGHYAKQVSDAWTARKAQAVVDELSAALVESADTTAAIREANNALAGLGVYDSIPIHRPGDFAETKMAQWEAAEQGKAIGVPFCLQPVNCVLGGLRYGIVSVLAAYRGTGKSTLTRQQADYAAECGHGTLLFTLEDTAEQADASIAGMRARVSTFHLDTGQSGEPYRVRVKQAWDTMREMPLWIVDRNCGVEAMGAIVQRLSREHGIKLVIVDHIQYISPHIMSGMNRVDTLAHYSTTLCGWAKEYDLHVMAVSQLSNAAEKDNRKRVRMSDIRGCGAIADDCRQAMALYEEDSGHVLEVLKNNAGISNRAVKVRRVDGEQRFEAN
jgi:replicative DNA helicase